MTALPAEAADRIVNVVPATGWWCVVAYRKPGEMFASHYTRTRVAAWALVEPGNRCEAMVASAEGPGLVLARETYASSDVYADDDLSSCDCGRCFGDDDDPNWCRDCGGVIAS